VQIRRFDTNPIIVPDMDAHMGRNINGPSLIRVPEWIERPLGRYYLYFAHHGGKYIRLAYADELSGPWTMHEPGVLPLDDTPFVGHVASPDAHVDHAERRIRMYFHGGCGSEGQWTSIARSRDGLAFDSQSERLGNGYFRVWDYGGWRYAMARSGRTYRSRDGLRDFEEGPQVVPGVRHGAVRVDGGTLHVFYSEIGDRPECIKHCTVDLRSDWLEWKASRSSVVLQPEEPWEGADLRLASSQSGWAPERVRELRDPALFEDVDGTWYILYSIAGESGIAIAEIKEW